MDFERFRLLLEEERERKVVLLPALRADIASADSARQDSNVDDEHDPEGATVAFELSQARQEARPWTPFCFKHASSGRRR